MKNNILKNILIKDFRFKFLAFCLISSAIVVIPFNPYFYYAGLIYIFFYSVYNSRETFTKGKLFIYFIISCFLSSLIALIFDARLIVFSLLLYSCTSITYSYKLLKFREKYLYYCLIIFPFISIVSLYCYINNINYFIPDKSIVSLDFSGLFPHPMWLGAAIGLSNVVLVWLLLKSKSFIYKLLLLLILISSIYLSIVAASRSAFVASLLAMLFLLFLKIRQLKKIFIYLMFISCFAYIAAPYYLSASKRMEEKFNNVDAGKYGSRTPIINVGIKHFKENPITGTGFAVSYNAEDKLVVGKMESGSGWLSILFQTGTLGFIIICIIVYKTKAIFIYSKSDDKLKLFISTFVFLSLHSLFEGYILTIGYYLGILFWSLLGYFYTYIYYHSNKSSIRKL